MPLSYVYDCFIQYDTIIDNDGPEPHEYQLYAGRVQVKPDILYDKRYCVAFDERSGMCTIYLYYYRHMLYAIAKGDN